MVLNLLSCPQIDKGLVNELTKKARYASVILNPL